MKPHIDGSEPSATAPATTRAVYAAELLALAALYVGAARIGLAINAVAGFATLVWAPSGIALAALLLRGHRLWPGVLIGAFVANMLTGAPVLVALGIATGNTLEAVLGAYALRRIPGFRASLDRVVDALGLIVLAAVLTTVVSATIGVASLYLGGIVSTTELGRAWRAWWVGDLIGDLLVAPAILVWAVRPGVRPASRHLAETAALVLAVIVIGFLVFGTRATAFHQAYLIFPLLVWAALRYGPRGAASAALAVSVIAVWGTATGRGPFVQTALYDSLLALQTFMGVTAATFLVLGASITERHAAIREARAAISEQQRLHAERDIAHQRLITVLEQSPIAIGIAEAPSGRFIFMNEEAGRLLGQRPRVSSAGDPQGGELKGLHPDGRAMAPHEWPLARALHHGETVRNAIIRIVRADETVEIASNAAPVRDASGRVIAGVVIFWDVTAERRAEQELRHAHETVAAANRAKAEFFAVMSHELRTPLNAIGGYVEVISLGIQGPLTEQQRDSLERIQRNQQHLLSVIEDVLVFAKLEADRLPLELKVVKVQEALDELDALVRPALQRKELTLTCDACDSTLSVVADSEKLRQILLNVVGNAIKFTPTEGRVRIAAVRDGATVRISVSDTGIGIPADQLSRIFEPFFQVERGPTRRYSGVGLGLSIASDLARAMRGEVQVVSTVNKGTTVSIALPAA